MKGALKFIAGIGLAGLFVWLILRDLDRASLAGAFRDLDPGWLALGFVFWALDYALRVLRWRSMLAVARPDLGFWRCAVPFLGSIAANNVLPFRLGDVLRCIAFSRWLGIDAGTVTATVFAERLLDLLTILVGLGLAILIFAPGTGAFGLLGLGAGGLVCVGIVALGLLFIPAGLRPLVRISVRGAALIGPEVAARLQNFAEPLLATLVILSQGRRMGGLIATSALIWTFEGAVYWTVAMAIPSMAEPASAWLALPVGTLATLLPSTPGYIGTFDYFAIAAAKVGGNSMTAATVFAVVVHLYFYLPATLFGGISLGVWHARRKRA